MSARDNAVAAVTTALTNSYDAGCGTMSRRNRQDPRRQAEMAVRTLIELGWTPPEQGHATTSVAVQVQLTARVSCPDCSWEHFEYGTDEAAVTSTALALYLKHADECVGGQS